MTDIHLYKLILALALIMAALIILFCFIFLILNFVFWLYDVPVKESRYPTAKPTAARRKSQKMLDSYQRVKKPFVQSVNNYN